VKPLYTRYAEALSQTYEKTNCRKIEINFLCCD